MRIREGGEYYRFMYRVRLPDGVAAEGLSLSEQEALRWKILPWRRKARILLYLARRLVRLLQVRIDRRAIARACAAAFANGVRKLRRFVQAARRYDLAKDIREFQLLAREIVLPWVPSVLFTLWACFAASTLIPARPVLSLEQRAEIARTHVPASCYFVDGEVWIYDSGRELRPGDRDYVQTRSDVCERSVSQLR